MDPMLSIPSNSDYLVDCQDDNLQVTKIKIYYHGVGLGLDVNKGVLTFPKLLWRKVYSIFSKIITSDNDDCHTISIEGLSTMTKSQCVDFTRILRKQMDEYAGFTKPASSKDYDHTFVVMLEYFDTSTSVVSSDTVTRWVTDDKEYARKTWSEWIQLEVIYAPGNLLSQLP